MHLVPSLAATLKHTHAHTHAHARAHTHTHTNAHRGQPLERILKPDLPMPDYY